MPSVTDTPPAAIRDELTRLRRQLGRDLPKKSDRNLLIATWNIREFGDLTSKWDSTQADTPKRDLHALACIKEIVKRFDVVAIQEAQKSLGALRELLVGLGRNWTVILTDPVEDDKGDDERLARRRDSNPRPSGSEQLSSVPPLVPRDNAPEAIGTSGNAEMNTRPGRSFTRERRGLTVV